METLATVPGPDLLRPRCAGLEARLRAGEYVRAEEFILPGDGEDNAVELIYTEFLCREELGQAPEPVEYLERFPRLRRALEEQFAVHRAIHGESTAPRSGQRVGKYELVRELGRGGRGAVYEARDGEGRTVALKLLLSGEYATPADYAEFRREAAVLARLDHPNLVKLLEAGVAENRPYMAMEYIDGPTLSGSVDGTMDPRDAARLVEQLARAMEYAHAKGVVHRDLKPANILMSRRGQESGIRSQESNSDLRFLIPDSRHLIPKVTDFGLAKTIDSASHRTRTGDIIGTLGYMAPEQAAGAAHHAGPAADVYSLGAILYELLAGRPPFDQQPTAVTLLKVLYDPPAAPHRFRTDCPRELETICLKCLEKNPVQRYSSAAALADDLERFIEGKPLAARPVGTLGSMARWAARRPTAAALLAVIALAGFGLTAGSVYYARKLGAALSVEEQLRIDADKTNLDLNNALHTTEGLRTETRKQKELAERQLEDTRRVLFALQLSQLPPLWSREPIRARELLADQKVCPPDLRDFTWKYFNRLCAMEEKSWDAHKGEITRVAHLPNGDLLTAGTDGLLKAWKETKGVPKTTAERLAHPGGVTALAVTDSGTIVSAGADRKVLFHAPGDPSADESYDAGTPVNELVACGKLLVGACGDGSIRVWRNGSREPERFDIAAKAIQAIALSKDGSRFAVAGDDGVIRMGNLVDGKVERELRGHSFAVLTLAFSPDGQSLASAGDEGEAKLWNLADETSRPLSGHLFAVRAAKFSPQGLLATTGFDSYLKFWSTEGSELTNLMKHRGTSLAFRGDRIVQGTGTGRLVTYRIPTLMPLPAYKLPSHVASMAMTSDKTFVAGDGSGHLTRWGSDRMRTARERVSSLPVQALAVSADGATLAHGDDSGAVILRDAATFQETGRMTGHEGPLYCLAFDKTGASLVSGGADGSIRIWNVAERTERLRCGELKQGVLCAAFSLDGKLVATGGEDNMVRIWNVATGEQTASLKGHTHWVLSMAFSPDGRKLATGSRDRRVRIWDVGQSDPPIVIGGYTNWIYSIAYSPDGRTLATASGHFSIDTPGELKFLDPRTGYTRAILGEFRAPIAFRPDGKTLYAGVKGGVAELRGD